MALPFQNYLDPYLPRWAASELENARRDARIEQERPADWTPTMQAITPEEAAYAAGPWNSANWRTPGDAVGGVLTGTISAGEGILGNAARGVEKGVQYALLPTATALTYAFTPEDVTWENAWDAGKDVIASKPWFDMSGNTNPVQSAEDAIDVLSGVTMVTPALSQGAKTVNNLRKASSAGRGLVDDAAGAGVRLSNGRIDPTSIPPSATEGTLLKPMGSSQRGQVYGVADNLDDVVRNASNPAFIDPTRAVPTGEFVGGIPGSQIAEALSPLSSVAPQSTKGLLATQVAGAPVASAIDGREAALADQQALQDAYDALTAQSTADATQNTGTQGGARNIIANDPSAPDLTSDEVETLADFGTFSDEDLIQPIQNATGMDIQSLLEQARQTFTSLDEQARFVSDQLVAAKNAAGDQASDSFWSMLGWLITIPFAIRRGMSPDELWENIVNSRINRDAEVRQNQQALERINEMRAQAMNLYNIDSRLMQAALSGHYNPELAEARTILAQANAQKAMADADSKNLTNQYKREALPSGSGSSSSTTAPAGSGMSDLQKLRARTNR